MNIARQAQDLYERVVARPQASWSEFLSANCEDAVVRMQVELMLARELEDRGQVLPAAADANALGANDPSALVEPDDATRALWREVDEIWDRSVDKGAYHAFVSADYHEVYNALVKLRGRLTTVLEWGSGLGAVTIMAANLGFEAMGIESEGELVRHSRELAEKYGPGAQFVHGSFIPADYEWTPEFSGDAYRSDVDVEPGYDELDMELRDFELVYAFPWPDELLLCQDIMRQCGAENALFLTYDAREGMNLQRIERALEEER